MFKKNKQAPKKAPKKFSLLTLIVTALVTLLLGGGAVFIFMNQRLQAVEQTNSSLGKIEAVYSALYNNYYKKVSRQKLENGALSGMVNALGDPFSEYMSKTETQSLNDTISSSFTGIGGAEVRKNGSHIEIIAPIDNTPAKKAGLKANDIIEEIDGKSMTGVSLSKAVSLIRGQKGTKVTLKIRRGSDTSRKY